MVSTNEGPDDLEKKLRQARDLHLLKTHQYDVLFADYLPVIKVTCAMQGLYDGESMEVAGVVMTRMFNEFRSGKDFTDVSVYGSIVYKTRWEAQGVRGKRHRPFRGDDELMPPGAIAEMEGLSYEDDHSDLVGEDYGYLYAAVESLTERQRLVIELLYLEDLSVSEVAEYLGATPNAVSQTKFQALKKLAAILGA